MKSFFPVDDDLLDFTLEGEEELKNGSSGSSSSLESSNGKTASFGADTQSGSLPEYEELEWLSNKDAFPSLDTCFPFFPDNPDLILDNVLSPISVLENTNPKPNNNNGPIISTPRPIKFPITHPVRARSKRRRTGPGSASVWKKRQEPFVSLPPLTKTIPPPMGRKCMHCQSDKTPQWRAGPMGPKTLCNACGVRYSSGRLFPEYRPANSPTFSKVLHSNSHRKVVEMRKKKEVAESTD